jgi:hypothetical protein
MTQQPLLRLVLLGFMCVFLGCADTVVLSPVVLSMSTSGNFSSGTQPDLSFVGRVGFGGTTDGGSLTLSNLGVFTLLKPDTGADTYHDEFSLILTFLAPLGIDGKPDATFDATLKGTVNTQKGSLLIDFGPAQTFTYRNNSNSGSFDLAIDDLTLAIPHDGTSSVSQILTGRISNAVDPPVDIAGQVPEPLSIVLLGTAIVLTGIAQRRRRVAN